MGWEIIPLGPIFGQREVVIPLAGIGKCEARGATVVVDTPNGEFFFVLGCGILFWLNNKAEEWATRISEAMQTHRMTGEARR